MIDDVPSQSLKKLGLQVVGGLECPAGGQHHVPRTGVIIAAKTGSGQVPCLKCRQPVGLERLQGEEA